MNNTELFKKLTPFTDFDHELLEKASESACFVAYDKGAMLFKRGKQVDMTYFLLKGSVNLIDKAFDKHEVTHSCKRALTALNDTSPTTASAITTSAVKLLKIPSAELKRLVALNQQSLMPTLPEVHDNFDDEMSSGIYGIADSMVVEEVDHTDWMSSLLQAPLFASIPGKNVQELFLRLEDHSAIAGDKIINEGKPGDYFYVLTSGTARVYNSSESVDETLNPGAYFGEEALLGNTTRNATIEMLTDGSLKRLDYDDFVSLLKTPILDYIDDSKLSNIDTPFEIIDVKMPIEYRFQKIDNSINIPLSRLRSHLNKLDSSKLFLINGDAGGRADIAAHLFCQAGFNCKILQKANMAESA